MLELIDSITTHSTGAELVRGHFNSRRNYSGSIIKSGKNMKDLLAE
jgi:hypothetical protein